MTKFRVKAYWPVTYVSEIYIEAATAEEALAKAIVLSDDAETDWTITNEPLDPTETRSFAYAPVKPLDNSDGETQYEVIDPETGAILLG